MPARKSSHPETAVQTRNWFKAMQVAMEWGAGMTLEGAAGLQGMHPSRVWRLIGAERYGRMRWWHVTSIAEHKEDDLCCPCCGQGKPRDRGMCVNCRRIERGDRNHVHREFLPKGYPRIRGGVSRSVRLR